jgi:putative sigma-54 modulation protein
MKIDYFGKNYTISDHLKKITEKKCRKLKKYFADDAVAKFTVNLYKNDYTTELTVTQGTKVVRAEAQCENPYKNLDVVIPKVEGQMRKKKSMFDKFKRGGEVKSKKPEASSAEQIASDVEQKPEFE